MDCRAPDADELAPCPLCGFGPAGIEVGTRGRYGMPVRNIACAECALVYQSPRPSRQALSEYYAQSYREHYADVSYPTEDGSAARPGDTAYDGALEHWHAGQAKNAELLARPQRGERVLEIGCRHGRTLALLRDRLGIVPFGIEPGLAEAEQARAAGIDCFAGTIEEFDAAGRAFDVIQIFHVLEHLHDPLASLMRLRALLAPGGRLMIEVPNVYQPYGALQGNFFQNAHLTNFSPVTLRALLVRAGYRVLGTYDQRTLFALASVDPDAAALPRPTEPARPSAEEHGAAWVAARLGSYERVEDLRAKILGAGPSMELLSELCEALQQPAFAPHTASTVSTLVDFFVQHGAPRAAMLVAGSAATGAHPEALRRSFGELASTLQRLAPRA